MSYQSHIHRRSQWMDTDTRKKAQVKHSLLSKGTLKLLLAALVVITVVFVLSPTLVNLLQPSTSTSGINQLGGPGDGIQVVFQTACSPFGALTDCLSIDAILASQPPT